MKIVFHANHSHFDGMGLRTFVGDVFCQSVEELSGAPESLNDLNWWGRRSIQIRMPRINPTQGGCGSSRVEIRCSLGRVYGFIYEDCC
jgi:hypothetical protein